MVNPEKVIKRRFLIEGLPEPLKPSDDHQQIFENYVAGTSLRLRSVRRPASDERRWFFERREALGNGVLMVNRIPLDRAEYDALRPLRGRELRKNRYLLTIDDTSYEFDVYLGDQWGLNVAAVRFAALADAEGFAVPEFSQLEITDLAVFDGPNLVNRTFVEIRKEFAKAKGGN